MNLPDEQLAQKAAAGDEAAFEALHRRHFGAVFRYVQVRSRCYEDAEEIAADAFVRCWTGLPRLQNNGSFKPWLLALARNASIDYYRSRGRRGEDPSPGPSAGDGNLGHSGAQVPKLAPLDTVSHKEEEQSLVAALGKLSQDHREVLELRVLAELSVKDTAETMGKSEDAIKMLLLRAIKKMQAISAARTSSPNTTGDGREISDER